MSLDGKYNTFYIITILMLENWVRIMFFYIYIPSLSEKSLILKNKIKKYKQIKIIFLYIKKLLESHLNRLIYENFIIIFYSK